MLVGYSLVNVKCPFDALEQLVIRKAFILRGLDNAVNVCAGLSTSYDVAPAGLDAVSSLDPERTTGKPIFLTSEAMDGFMYSVRPL